MAKTADIAKKQRYLNLLKKVREGRSLSVREIAELEGLEQAYTAPAKKQAVKKKKPSGRSRRPSAVAVKGWGLRYEAMADCEAGEGLSYSLAALTKTKTYRDAWQRGQLLRKLRDLGGVALTVDEIARELAMTPEALEALFNADAEAYETFNHARIAAIVSFQTTLSVEAAAGKPTAARQMMNLMRREVAKKSTDFEHVPTSEMASLAGVSRQVLSEQWVKRHDCPKNADGTYNLYKFIPWYEQFVIGKINRQPGKFLQRAKNPLADPKAEKIQLEVDAYRGKLWPREQVLCGLVARAMAIANYIDRKGAELPMMLTGQGEAKIAATLLSFFSDLRRSAATVPGDIRQLKMPPELWQQTEQLLTAAAGAPAAADGGDTNGTADDAD
jgi:hypothetical protein